MGRRPAEIDVDELRRLYVFEQRSLADVGRILGTNYETVRLRLHKLGIPVRPTSYPGMRSRKIGASGSN